MDSVSRVVVLNYVLARHFFYFIGPEHMKRHLYARTHALAQYILDPYVFKTQTHLHTLITPLAEQSLDYKEHLPG